MAPVALFSLPCALGIAQTPPSAGAALPVPPVNAALPAVPDPPPVVPDAQKLTLAQAQEIATQNSPLLKVAAYQVAGARANFAGQRAPINPLFNVGGLNNSTGSSVGPLDLGNPSNYALIFTVETNGGMGWRTSQSRNQLLGTQADAETIRLAVRQAVANAYDDLQVANTALENEQSAFANVQRLADLTEKQFGLGAAPETNAIRTRIALTQEQSSVLKAINDVRAARTNLNLQIGRKPSDPVDAADPLTFKPVQLNLETLAAAADRQRSELRSADFNRRALQATVGLQRSQYYPNLFVGTDLRAIRKGTFQFGLTLPLFDFGSIGNSVRKARQDVKAQEAQTTQVQQQVRADVETAFYNLTRSQGTVAAFQDGILPRSASLLQRIQQGYALGASTILDLIDAQNTYRSARNDYASALGDYRRALAQLERAIGGPLPPEGKTP